MIEKHWPNEPFLYGMAALQPFGWLAEKGYIDPLPTPEQYQAMTTGERHIWCFETVQTANKRMLLEDLLSGKK